MCQELDVPSGPSSTSLAAPAALDSRRCWRCLETFPVTAVAGEPLDDWWLCQPCGELLLPGKAVTS
jgi:hypothetical protein